MNAIILAAGEGKRLRPLTNDKPKCLVELFGKTLLEWQLSIFKKCGINDICIVTGHNSQMFRYTNVDYIKNENYKTTNMMESLFCAKERFSQSTIVSYGDIIFEEKILRKLIDSEDDFSVIIDNNWKDYWSMRFDEPINDAESLSVDDNGYITSIGKKVKEISEIQGQYIGLMKFQNGAINTMKSFYEKCTRNFKNSKINPLNPKISFGNSFMTDFLQGLIDHGIKLKAVNINNGWLELDNINDYRLYTEPSSKSKIHKFFDIND